MSVRASIDARAADLLGRHVLGVPSALLHAAREHVGQRGLREAEVEDLDQCARRLVAMVTNRFAGFTSRWMIPCACASASASQPAR